jgi:hypothetical protein
LLALTYIDCQYLIDRKAIAALKVRDREAEPEQAVKSGD